MGGSGILFSSMALPSFFEDRKRAPGEGDPVYRQVDAMISDVLYSSSKKTVSQAISASSLMIEKQLDMFDIVRDAAERT
jgi:hypothetical protein